MTNNNMVVFDWIYDRYILPCKQEDAMLLITNLEWYKDKGQGYGGINLNVHRET